MELGSYGSLGVAALIGMRHGFDADHLAAIHGVSRLNSSAGRAGLARSSGLRFAAGHAAVVLLAALWIHAGALRIPGWVEAAGGVISVLLLLTLGVVNLRLALGRAPGSSPGVLAAALLRSPVAGHPAGGLLIGALFALSFDTLAIAAWFASVAVSPGPTSVLVLAACFCAGMMLCDGLNGLWVSRLIGRSAGFPLRSQRSFAALIACGALAMAGIGAVRLAFLPFQTALGDSTWISVALLAMLMFAFVIAGRGTAAPSGGGHLARAR